MSEKTFIKGKDASLEDSISKMQVLLKNAGFEIEEVSWLNPVANVYSVHIRDKKCPALFTNGKGSCKKSCLASAYGEFLERLASNYFFSDFYLAEQTKFTYYADEKVLSLAEFKDALTPELWQLYDVKNEWQSSDFLSLNDAAQSITCLPMVEATSGEKVYFPVNVFSNLYASNGLCAGNTFVEAKVQGLSEVFERWVKSEILKQNICLPEVPNKIIERYSSLNIIISDLKKHGLEVSVRDASLGGKYPVISVILFEQATGKCFASFGAHPIFEVAIERTLTESLQGRKLGELDGFQTPIFDAELVADDENIENHFIDSSGLIHAKFISQDYDYAFTEWNFKGDTKAQYQNLVSIINQLGKKVYIAEYSHFDLPVCRIVVPSMSEVFPIDELMDNNQNQGRVLRELLQSYSAHKDAEQTLEELETLGLTDHQGVANLIGLLPDAGSKWKKLKVIELKMFLLLANQDYEQAYETLQDCFYFVDDQQLQTFYQALSMSLEIILYEDQTVYNKAMLSKLFGESIIDKVNLSIAGECLLYGLAIGEDAFTQSKNHQKLLKTYQIVQQHKK